MFANNLKYLPSPATLSFVIDGLKQTDLAVTTDDSVDFSPSGKCYVVLCVISKIDVVFENLRYKQKDKWNIV